MKILGIANGETASACLLSSYISFSKPIEKVLTLESEIFFNKAVINEESIPPDRKTPKGTSDKLWPFKISKKRFSKSFILFSYVPLYKFFCL